MKITQHCKNIEQDLCSSLFWSYRGVGRMGSRGFWYCTGRQWHQL